MKKLLISIICFQFISLPAYSEIEDEFVNKTLDKNLEITTPAKVYINDSFVENSLDKNLEITYKKYIPISDSFAEGNKNKNIYTEKKVNYQEIIPKTTTETISKKVVVFDTNSMIPVNVKIQKEYTTKSSLQEGDTVEFKTVQDVKINEKFYPAGTPVKARLETVSLNKSRGVPSELVISNFSLDKIPLAGEINKVGANKSLWVYPCIFGLSWFFGAGLLFIPVRGGHTKVKTSETYTLYAE